jgi:RND family efflux transporter MFP subunit
MTDDPAGEVSKRKDDASTPPPRRRRHVVAVLIAVAVLAVATAAGVLPRVHQRRHVRAATADNAFPYVAVTRPERVTAAQEIVLPGNVQPYTSAPIFARVNGYVRTWHFDIGAHVKQGQLLAELDVPELEQQLQQARGTLAASQANLRLSDVTAKRFTDLQQTRAVSQQEVDTAVNAYNASQATVAANVANVRQLEAQLAYARVVAPFDGIITVRNVDIGDLVNAGSSATPGTALFQMVKSDTLRVYVSVPEPYADSVKPKLVVELLLMTHAGTRFSGTVVRTARAIDPTTRTLLVEIHVPNPTLELLSGAFAEVHLSIPSPGTVFTIPVEALVFRKEGLQIATVVDGRVALKPITPGRDFGDRIEVTQGLEGDELAIVSPPDSIATGQQVRVAQQATVSKR